MRILAVTPWDGQGTPTGKACGIANYAEMLRDHLPTEAEFIPDAEALDPASYSVRSLIHDGAGVDAVWLNYHRGLHSRWTPSHVIELQYSVPVVITFHDTYGEREPDDLTRELYEAADAFIVHEPCEGLPKAQVIRQGVLGWQGEYILDRSLRGAFAYRPVLGTCGFNFPWKNYDRLCQVTAEVGWGMLIVSNNATVADFNRWTALNPHLQVEYGYRSSTEIISRLAGCDATAFPYECANSGTSGAIRLGIAARKPVIALWRCRQFRDLHRDDDCGEAYITWVDDWDHLGVALESAKIQRVDPGIVALAERDSWTRHGLRYAHIFEQVALP